ncbi:DUF2750 domain-containing protein [Mangrovibacillus cuniculi]|uniref:DUF2750 domain-containing protein n=1 Tax=Mangrovibacillus cuniculi TaxID=2593652 RepID=A0A7S8CCZ5_9BACI|nr:DUF2750 domain-containing protein [Mangrovibacillus cuniculi]QPC47637.1 DUF2750 domain-containing protein [Mangrovibacillus cuniculi]
MSFGFTIDSKKRYDAFLRKVVENKKVWGLEHNGMWCVCESTEYEDTLVMPFWSDEAYARQCNINEWSHYKPTPIPLEIFLSNWIYGMNEEGHMVGVNWNSKLIGVEVEPFDLLDEIERRLANN